VAVTHRLVTSSPEYLSHTAGGSWGPWCCAGPKGTVADIHPFIHDPNVHSGSCQLELLVCTVQLDEVAATQ
jgi:hypothetical protein